MDRRTCVSLIRCEPGKGIVRTFLIIEWEMETNSYYGHHSLNWALFGCDLYEKMDSDAYRLLTDTKKELRGKAFPAKSCT